MLKLLKGIVSWSLLFLYRLCAVLSMSLFCSLTLAETVVLYCSFVGCMLPDTAIALVAWLSFFYWSPNHLPRSYFS